MKKAHFIPNKYLEVVLFALKTSHVTFIIRLNGVDNVTQLLRFKSVYEFLARQIDDQSEYSTRANLPTTRSQTPT